MKAKQYFKQIQHLKLTIMVKQQRIKIYRQIASTPATQTYSALPKPPKKTNSVMERALICAIDLEQEVAKDITRYSELKVQAMELIGKLEDTTCQQVLLLRYFENKKWEDIFTILCYSKSSIHSIHNKALERIEEML